MVDSNAAQHIALSTDALVIGAGPAGIAVAVSLAEQNHAVVLLEQMPQVGGQIWRNAGKLRDNPEALHWLTRLAKSSTQIFCQTRVVNVLDANTVLAESSTGTLTIKAKQIVIAVGARETMLPYPGWTLPQVTGAGALQVMVKDGLQVRGQRVLVAGSGPLLLAVADTLQKNGAIIEAIVEQRSLRELLRFACGLWRWPKLILQAAALAWRLRKIRFTQNAWISSASGDKRVSEVVVQRSNNFLEKIPVDWLACGFGLSPNREMADLFAASANGKELDHLHIIGDGYSIAGVNAALASGVHCAAQILGQSELAERAAHELKRHRDYGQYLSKHFPLRAELKQLALDDTLVCRCEQVRFGALRDMHSLREAKLYTRLSMGRCQGRICASACEHLFGWPRLKAKPPLYPTRIGLLTQQPNLINLDFSNPIQTNKGVSP